MRLEGAPVQVLTLLYVIRPEDGRVLMLKRSPTKKFLPNWLVAPGGKVEADETPQAGALREFHEETGLTAEGVELRGTYSFTTDSAINRAGVIYLFSATSVKGNFVAEVADGQLGWHLPEELLNNPLVMDDHKVFMREIFNGTPHIACMGDWAGGKLLEWADSDAYFEQRRAAA